MKLGSLFDGSGGFPLAGSLCGIEPVWAAEVEPYPIAVTKSRFPKMKHLGNICNINGAEIEPVDIITFGSPCQDLSVAGKRAGLKHEDNGDEETTRSGLFMEAVRIIKEMRSATNGRYPTFALWENVPGAFSSNQGEDFRIVLEELIKIAEPTAKVPAPPKGGWAYSDIYLGDGWSLAYRVFDAQYWGVPQRRRRIHLVADFRGGRAGEILFKREGLRRHPTASGETWQGVAGNAEDCSGATDREGKASRLILDDQGGSQINVRTDGKAPTIRAEMHGNVPCVMQAAGFKAGNGAKANGIGWQDETAPTLLAAPSGTNQAPTVCAKVYDARGHEDGNIASTLTGDHENRITDYTAVVCEPVFCLQGNGIDRAYTAGCNGKGVKEDVCYTLNTIDRPAVAYAMQAFGKYAESDKASAMKARDYKDATDLVVECAGINCRNMTEYPELYPTLQAKPNGGQSLNFSGAVRVRYIVRRLTPTECARLQGFPDKWGHPDPKTELTDEEYAFWCKVNLDLAIIGGTARPNDNGWYNVWRDVKPNKNKGEDFDPYFEDTGKPYAHKSQDQMLKWYNKLHTDSAEYKMWGNGIALPPALYCMQGMAEALKKEEHND